MLAAISTGELVAPLIRCVALADGAGAEICTADADGASLGCDSDAVCVLAGAEAGVAPDADEPATAVRLARVGGEAIPDG